jgi:hypothetical protein
MAAGGSARESEWRVTAQGKLALVRSVKTEGTGLDMPVSFLTRADEVIE